MVSICRLNAAKCDELYWGIYFKHAFYKHFFLRKMCLLFNISHDSQPIKCTNPNWTFQTGGNVLGTIFSGGVIHIWCSSVECGYVSVVHLFSFSPESFSDLISPHSFLTSCFLDFTPHLSCHTFLTQQSLVCAHLLLLWQRAADPDSPRSDAPPKRVGNGADSDTAAVR